MRKISLLLAGLAVLTATPAMAYTVVYGSYRNHGHCNEVLKYFAIAERNDDFTGWGYLSDWAYSDLGCEKIGERWWIVVY